MANQVLNAYVDDGGNNIIVIERVGDGFKERRIRAEYTTYHKATAISTSLMRTLKSAEQVAHVVRDGKTWIRIGWKNDGFRRQARYKFKDQGIETYEGDVDPVRYWLTETKAIIARPRRCYVDIETDSRVSFSKKEEMRILCWAVSDDTGPIAKGVLEEDTDDAETDLLEELWKVLANYDQVCAWYGGTPDDKNYGFDFYVIATRSRRRGLPIDTRRWLWLDQLAVWDKMNSAESGDEKESMRLEDIAQAQIKEGKEKTPDWVVEKFGDKNLGALAWDLWAADGKFRKLLVDYCVKDTELLRKLEKRKGFIQLFQTLCEVCGIIPVSKSLGTTQQMDGFLLRLGRERDQRFPTKWYDGSPTKKFKGAYVMPAHSTDPAWRKARGMETGILRDVHVCDFSGMYPSIIITWNLSSETLCDAETVGAYMADRTLPENVCMSPGTGVLTHTNVSGILPVSLLEMIRLRKHFSDLSASLPPGTPEWSDAMAKSTAYKVAANAFYGGSGSPGCRFFDVQVAESTSQNGAYLIQSVIKHAEKRKMDPVGGDTDSAFVMGPTREGFAKYVQWCNDKLLPSEVSKHGCKDNHIKLAFEKTFELLIIVAPKNYIGKYSHYKGKAATADSKPEIKGLAYKRGDWGVLARRLQGRIIDLLVGGLNLNPGVQVPTEDIEIYRSIITEARDNILSNDMRREDIKLSKSLSKSLKEYGKKKNGEEGGGVPAHVQVARILASRGEDMQEGSKVDYIVVDGSVSPMRVIPAADYTGECDRFHLWESGVYPPTRRLLEAAFPNEDWETLGNVRPPKPKKRGAKVLAGQLGFSLTPKVTKEQALEELAVPVYSAQPLSVRVPESLGSRGLEKLKKAFKENPGARSVEIILVLDSGGEAVLNIPLRVSTGPKLKAAVQEILNAS